MSASVARAYPDAEAPREEAREGAIRVGRNFVYRIASQCVSALINVAAMVLLGRALGAEGYGEYTFYYALVPLVSNLAGAGIGLVVSRDIARDPERAPRLIGDAILARLILAGLVVAGAFAIAPRLVGSQQTLLVLVVAIAAVLDFGQDVSIWVLRAHERLDLEARLLLLSQVIWLGLIAGAVFLHEGLTVLLAAAAVAFAIRTAAGAWIVHRSFHRARFEPDFGRLVRLVREGLPFALALFGVVLYGRIGLLTLKSLATTLDVSYFQVAYLLSQPFTFIATGLAMAMFPVMARRIDEPLRLHGSLRRALKCQFLMGLPLTLGLILLAEPLIHLLFQDADFAEAAIALRILALGITVSFLNHAARYALAALDRQRDSLIAAGIGIVVNATMCALLVPRFGYVGACIAFRAAQVGIWVVSQRALARHVHPAQVARDAFRPLLAGAIAAVWIVALDKAPAILVGAAAVATYALLLWRTHALTPGELKVLTRVVRSFTPGRAVGPRPVERVAP